MEIVIVGSGIAGVTFAEKYRELSPKDHCILVTQDHDGFYSRPLLSRGFTKTDIEQSIIVKSFNKLREEGIELIGGTVVTAIDREAKTIALDGPGQEKELSYDKLVLAQGSAAFTPPPFRPYARLFFSLNSLADLKAMRKFRQPFTSQNRKPHWAVIGGGLIGCEVASDLATAGDTVTIYHAMDRLMERQLEAEDSAALLKVLNASGVEVLFDQSVQSLAEEGDKICVKTEGTAEYDAVIMACGFQPRKGLAEAAGLAVGRGIKVNGNFQTEDDSIFALGDVAELPDSKIYAFIIPIRNQALWLAKYLAGEEQGFWTPPSFTTKAKVHGFEAAKPYRLV
jgi:NAD(P)H-nitrite reductase large subunit